MKKTNLLLLTAFLTMAGCSSVSNYQPGTIENPYQLLEAKRQVYKEKETVKIEEQQMEIVPEENGETKQEMEKSNEEKMKEEKKARKEAMKIMEKMRKE